MAPAPPVAAVALIIPFQPRWLGSLREQLRALELPWRDIRRSDLHRFRIALGPEGTLIGSAGLEVHGQYGLLRSVTVAAEYRAQGIGAALVAAIEEQARDADLVALYLLTDTAERYFANLGFARCARGDAPDEIQRTTQLAGGCAETAALLRKRLA